MTRIESSVIDFISWISFSMTKRAYNDLLEGKMFSLARLNFAYLDNQYDLGRCSIFIITRNVKRILKHCNLKCAHHFT